MMGRTAAMAERGDFVRYSFAAKTTIPSAGGIMRQFDSEMQCFISSPCGLRLKFRHRFDKANKAS